MKVLNFGSLNLDYVYSVDSFLRPGETKSANGRNTFLGGKGFNQSVALAKAGAPVWHAGDAGESAGLFRQELESCGAHTDLSAGERRCVRPCGDPGGPFGTELHLIYHGSNYSIEESFVNEVLDRFSEGDIVVLQNEINATHYIIDEAHRRGMRIALNPSPYDERHPGDAAGEALLADPQRGGG